MLRRAITTAPRTVNRISSGRCVIMSNPRFQNQAPLVLRRSYHEKDMYTSFPSKFLTNMQNLLLDHYSRPRNVGSMVKTDADVGTGLVGAPACGDVMKLQIRVDPVSQRISDVKFKTFGCGSAIASSSYLTELVRGMTLEDAGKIRNTEIAKELCLPPVKCQSTCVSHNLHQACIFDEDLLNNTNFQFLFDDSTLLYARRRCHQIRNLELLH